MLPTLARIEPWFDSVTVTPKSNKAENAVVERRVRPLAEREAGLPFTRAATVSGDPNLLAPPVVPLIH